ncbi:MAG TPA: branched-chain amino acid ABC transporter permease [Acidimicrobiia bacterium]|nr:branched-chain amino acid ABC transporter permease [Acidimicrobiia bacterium]
MNWGAILQSTMSQAFGVNAMVFAMATIGLNVHFGYTGLLNFGHIGFVAMGGYGLGMAITTFGWNPWLGILVGVIYALIFALILGLPTLRLRGDYLAIVTIAASEVLRILVRSTTLADYTGGNTGITGFAGAFYQFNPFTERLYQFGPFFYTGPNLFILTVGWPLVILVTLGVWQLMRSPWGRVVKAIREDEDAARALGKNAYWYKLQSLMLGGAIGGLAGMLLAIANSTVQPDYFVPVQTFFLWAAMILGGVGRIGSPIVGSIIFWAMLTLTDGVVRALQSTGVIPSWIMDGPQVGQVRFMLVGIGLALLMVYRPQGIFGSRQEMMLDAR